MSPKVSIIIPCYNQARFLPDALASVLAQTLEDWECIVVDDGSTDNTREISLDFCTTDSRITYIEQNNLGLSAARNSGLKAATGKYIQFLDSDDLITPNKLEEQLHVLENSQNKRLSICSFYYCAENDTTQRVQEDKVVSTKIDILDPLNDLINRWENGLSIPVHCFLFDATIFTQYKIRFNTKLANHEDWDCWMRIFSKDITIHYIDKKLAIYRVHPASLTKSTLTQHNGYLKAIKIQKIIHRKSPNTSKLLSNKMDEVIQNIRKERDYIKFKKKKNSLYLKIYKRYTPWPAQKMLARANKYLLYIWSRK